MKFCSRSIITMHVLLITITGTCLLCVDAVAPEQLCQRPPPWTTEGDNPMEMSRGNVTIVALLDANCFICRQQARGLEVLLDFFNRRGLCDVNVMIINKKDNNSTFHDDGPARRVTFPPVYQDTPELDLWSRVFRGQNQDFLYYDRRFGQHTGRILATATSSHYEMCVHLRDDEEDSCYKCVDVDVNTGLTLRWKTFISPSLNQK